MDEIMDGDTYVVDGSGKGLTAEEKKRAAEKKVTNDEQVELMWLQQAVTFFTTYMKVIRACKDLTVLRLTTEDDNLYKVFRIGWPDMKVDVLDLEKYFNSKAAKEKWRPFIMSFKEKIKDFDVGTMLRIDSSKGYTEENSLLVVRVQFYAIEIARNREGLNLDLPADDND